MGVNANPRTAAAKVPNSKVDIMVGEYVRNHKGQDDLKKQYRKLVVSLSSKFEELKLPHEQSEDIENYSKCINLSSVKKEDGINYALIRFLDEEKNIGTWHPMILRHVVRTRVQGAGKQQHYRNKIGYFVMPISQEHLVAVFEQIEDTSVCICECSKPMDIKTKSSWTARKVADFFSKTPKGSPGHLIYNTYAVRMSQSEHKVCSDMARHIWRTYSGATVPGHVVSSFAIRPVAPSTKIVRGLCRPL